ncbi:MAG: DUF1080 domain-containing protein [Proteobacteria bacterium]|nr:DUF1080 domain-containing protein [Pseudomonadota bacterium]
MNKRMQCFGLYFVLCLSACAVTRQARGDQISLFDGDTLAGWRLVGAAEWRVINGAIEAAGDKDGYLVTEKTFADYRLTLEFWIEATTNSGVFIGCPTQVLFSPEVCYEINIWDEHPRPSARTGSIVLEVMPPLAYVETVGKWNTYEITSMGSTLVVELNGIVTAELDNTRAEAGYIALQHAGTGRIRFRNLRLSH